jgi:hypothetical protein
MIFLPTMRNQTYNMAFTAGSLLHQESVKLASLYQISKDWDIVKEEATSSNVMQARTLSTSMRVIREVLSRLKTLSDLEIQFLVGADHQQQKYLLWIAICRRYYFIADFAIEVLMEQLVTQKNKLSLNDYDVYYARKSEWHDELEQISLATKKKLKQILFRMMRETGILARDFSILAAIPSNELIETVSLTNRRDLSYLPVLYTHLKGSET